ncbi:MAG: circularly permuted type 2 ATP-grasp protein, partial [Chloroflexota bacterium]
MTQTSLDSLLSSYQPELNTYDEMWLNPEEVQPHWRTFVDAITALDADELERLEQEAARQLRENGVTYNVHGDPDNINRLWELDLIPLIISHQDWQMIEAGLKQRAELLNLILTDIYGSRSLLKSGLLPPELIYGHNGFLRQCDGIQLPGNYHLITYAADLARGPDGRMWVLGDRTQAPSGAGYALENRTVLARVLGSLVKDNKVFRLANYFRELQVALAGLAMQRSSESRVAVLSPGPLNETYFEHAYLASYLGFTLVQGDDLTVYNGQVSLKSLEGLQPVDVILRRVDDLFCDPLELREDSRLGVAGLLEASRRQNVVIVNPLGSSVLENPGLMPFMSGLAKQLLGEELLLPSAATWWCGQPKELDYVLQNLPNLVIKTLHRQAKSRTIYGPELDEAQLETLRRQIMAHPQLYVGQEQVSFSTTPSLINGKLEPRHAVVRCFSVASRDGYTVMPGGLTRSAPVKGGYVVSNRAGGISKDTWVQTPIPQKHVSLWLQTDRIERAVKSSYQLPSRAAENLFWVGRYAERTEASARLLRVILNYLNEGEPFGGDEEITAAVMPSLFRALTHVTMTYPGFVGEAGEPTLAQPEKELLSIAFDNNRAGSLRFNLNSLAQSAYAVRNLWSPDTWRVIKGLDTHLVPSKHSPRLALQRLETRLNELITNLMAFAGLNTESMTHEAGWLLLDIGRRLERALLSISLIRAVFGISYPEAVEYLLLDATLRTTENVITYRRRYRSRLQLQTVLDLLLLDQTNPRSLTYQLDRLQTHIAALPREMAAYRLSEEERLVLDASTRLHLVDTDLLTVSKNETRGTLDDFLAELFLLLGQLSPILTQNYFTHVQVPYQRLTATTFPDIADGLDDTPTDQGTLFQI